MSDYSKKRRASTEDESDGGVPHKASKKNKSQAAAARPTGKDDEGNPYWEVRYFALDYLNYKLIIAPVIEQATNWRVKIQGHVFDQYSRIL